MTKFAIALILASAAFTGTAHAQTFDGPRVEARIGMDRQRFEGKVNTTTNITERDEDMVYGAGVGYDSQQGAIVVGFDLAVDFPQGQICNTLSGNMRCLEIKNDIEGSLRLGAAVSPNLLVYGRAGGSFIDLETRFVPATGASQQGEDRSLGYLVGAGVEFAATQGFYAKAEFRYSDYDDLDSVTDFFGFPVQPSTGGAEPDFSRTQIMGAVGFRF
ncbi:MAG TPA: outer membrane beta-barrel protein [Allosphingosinicella sp.]|nr:outer membrane beta-barrel protein [Allosphingosinicella sp.]